MATAQLIYRIIIAFACGATVMLFGYLLIDIWRDLEIIRAHCEAVDKLIEGLLTYIVEKGGSDEPSTAQGAGPTE